MQVIRFIDLFAGTGGIRLAFEEAIRSFNIEPICVKSAEIDKRACETYENNFGDNPYCDVRELTEIPQFDALLAGFPCQSFSYAGKQLGFGDTRGTLFFEIERILKRNKPRFCFLENVRGLTSHDNGRTLKTIIDRLNNLGYYTKYWLLNSSNHGVPQNRVRIYIIASLIPINNIGVESSVGANDSHSYKRDYGGNKAMDIQGQPQTLSDKKHIFEYGKRASNGAKWICGFLFLIANVIYIIWKKQIPSIQEEKVFMMIFGFVIIFFLPVDISLIVSNFFNRNL